MFIWILWSALPNNLTLSRCWWKPLSYSQSVRSTGNNLDLRLVSDVEAAFWGWGLGPWNRSLSRGRGPQSWVEFVHLESENGVLVWGSLHTCPGTGSGDPKAIPTPIPPPSFLLSLSHILLYIYSTPLDTGYNSCHYSNTFLGSCSLGCEWSIRTGFYEKWGQEETLTILAE